MKNLKKEKKKKKIIATTFQGWRYIRKYSILQVKESGRFAVLSIIFFSRCNNYVQQKKAGLLSNNQPETTNQKLGPHSPPLPPCYSALAWDFVKTNHNEGKTKSNLNWSRILPISYRMRRPRPSPSRHYLHNPVGGCQSLRAEYEGPFFPLKSNNNFLHAAFLILLLSPFLLFLFPDVQNRVFKTTMHYIWLLIVNRVYNSHLYGWYSFRRHTIWG